MAATDVDGPARGTSRRVLLVGGLAVAGLVLAGVSSVVRAPDGLDVDWSARPGQAPRPVCSGQRVGGTADFFGDAAGAPDVAAAALRWRATTFQGRDLLVTARTYGATRGTGGVSVVWSDAADVPRAVLGLDRTSSGGWVVVTEERCASILPPDA